MVTHPSGNQARHRVTILT